ncbi:hypothetical protein ACWTQZ_25920, partial [Escherichia coli]
MSDSRHFTRNEIVRDRGGRCKRRLLPLMAPAAEYAGGRTFVPGTKKPVQLHRLKGVGKLE